MKLSPHNAARYFAHPEAQRAGLLLYGNDAMRVALKRQQVIAALIGPCGEEEMRLTRIAATELRRDPALLADAIKAQGFFPGPRVAFVEDVTDALAKVITAALEDWREGDAQVVITAGSLTPRSALRKYFETHPNAYAAGIYDDPPSRAEIEAALTQAGLASPAQEAMAALTILSRQLGPGDFRQLIEKLSLYKLGDETPLSPADIDALAPTSSEAALDEILNITADGNVARISPILHRLQAQGTQPVGLCIGATRHFRTLHAAASNPGGAAQGIMRARPPVHFKMRDRMVKQAQKWGVKRLERALEILVDTDLQLRSAARAPQMAVMERTLIRLAMMGGR